MENSLHARMELVSCMREAVSEFGGLVLGPVGRRHRERGTLRASRAAEAAALQGHFWEMHALLFHRQRALEDDDLHGYASDLGLDLARFDEDRAGEPVLERVGRDVRSGVASGGVLGTPTLFIDGTLHAGSYDHATLLAVLAGEPGA